MSETKIEEEFILEKIVFTFDSDSQKVKVNRFFEKSSGNRDLLMSLAKNFPLGTSFSISKTFKVVINDSEPIKQKEEK